MFYNHSKTALIALDYKWNLRNLEYDTKEYDETLSKVFNWKLEIIIKKND